VLAIYFVAPATLAALDPSGCPAVQPRGVLDLSPLVSSPGLDLGTTTGDDAPSSISTAGKKDLRLVSTGAPLPLAHFAWNPAFCRPSYAHALRALGARLLAERSPAQVCFALDERLAPLTGWLAARGVTTDTRATVLGLSLPGSRRGIVHLATSDI
jgi:hypothetical protein